jgi:hypothetical protein
VESKCGCLHSTFLCVICNFDLLFSLVTMDTAQICLLTILLNTVAVELYVQYHSNIHCKTILSVATLCGMFTVKLHNSWLSLLSLKWWLLKVWQWILLQCAPHLAVCNRHYAVTSHHHHYHQFLLSLRGHRASTKHHHLVLFLANLLTSLQFLLSFSCPKVVDLGSVWFPLADFSLIIQF